MRSFGMTGFQMQIPRRTLLGMTRWMEFWSSSMLYWLAASVTNVQYIHGAFLNHKQNSIYMRSMAVKQLADFKRDDCAFGGEVAALRKLGERLHCFSQRPKPA